MSDRLKLVLIGAGSTVFTQRLVADLILSGESDRWELALVDIDPVTLKAVDALVRKMLLFKRVNFPIVSTTDRREVLPGADFVVTTIAVGGRRGWEIDSEERTEPGLPRSRRSRSASSTRDGRVVGAPRCRQRGGACGGSSARPRCA